MLPFSIVGKLEKALARKTGLETTITSSQAIGGGSINQTVKITYGAANFFVKWNRSDVYPGMFDFEKVGLELIGKESSIRVPEIIESGNDASISYLLMEYIPATSPTHSFWESFGIQLAEMHQKTAALFGLNHSNYIGSLPQKNTLSESWDDFYLQQRLLPLISTAQQKKLLSSAILHSFDRLTDRIKTIFPIEKPSLLHGDLWSGNFLCSGDKQPVLIDPAVYYGHREMDIAMTQLFGGFHPIFYEAYNHRFPLEKGWQERVDVCNLYPVLVHVILFGDSYVFQLENMLRRILR